MKASDHLLLSTLSALSTHRELIREAYERGGIGRTAENARELYVLHQHRILVTEGHDSYRLAGSLSRFFDGITQRQRLFEFLGESIGTLNERVFMLKDEYGKAVLEGKIDDIDNVVAQFHDACAELSDAMTSGISTLLIQAENNFATVNSLTAKQRQNEHYIKQAENLGNALGSLERMNMQDLLDIGSSMYQGLAEPYRRLITNRMPEWDMELIRVTAILKTYLFKLRLIEPDVKRLRGFAKFLLQNPGYTPPNFDGERRLPAWLMRDHGIKLVAFPDQSNEAIRPELEAIARKLPAPRIILKQHKEAGVLSKTAGERKVEKIVLPPYRVALQRLGITASKSAAPISATQWIRDNGNGLDIPEDVWLLLVLHSQDISRWPFTRLTYERIGRRGEAPISKNHYLRDVVLHGT